MRGLLRAPLLHFLAGGAVLFALGRLGSDASAPTPPPPAPIVFTSDDVRMLVEAYERDTGLPVTPADETALIREAADDEAMYREGVARGLDRFDRSVRHRLIEKMRFLADDAQSDDETMYRRALELGLDREDTVIRRLVVRKMRFLVSNTGEAPPDDDTLRAYFARHGDDYRAPPTVSFRHVFFSRGERGAEVGQEATALVERLRREHAGAGGAGTAGDAFPLATSMRSASAREVSKAFGADFAAAVFEAPVGRWTGSLASPYGAHVVWVESRQPSALPDFAAVRSRVLERWKDEQRERRLAEAVHALREHYPVQADSDAWRARERG
jgi:hypothetical protein